MDISVIKKTFNNEIAEELTINLFDTYDKALKEYSKRNWQYFINEIGQFNEVIYRILEFLLVGNYTPFKDKLPVFNETILVKWENIPNKEANIRIIMPRVLYSMYCIRNKRGAIHKNEINPNKMDSTVLLYNAKWMLAELFRIFSKLTIIESQNIIESITNKEIELLWQVNDKTRVLNNNISCCDQILILLYIYNSMSLDNLISNIEYSNKTVFKKILKELHKNRFIEFDGINCTISPKGLIKAEQIIKDNN